MCVEGNVKVEVDVQIKEDMWMEKEVQLKNIRTGDDSWMEGNVQILKNSWNSEECVDGGEHEREDMNEGLSVEMEGNLQMEDLGIVEVQTEVFQMEQYQEDEGGVKGGGKDG